LTPPGLLDLKFSTYQKKQKKQPILKYKLVCPVLLPQPNFKFIKTKKFKNFHNVV